MDLEIREVTPSDVEKAISLHNAAYGDKKKPEHWIWEYKGGYPDSSVFTIIEDGDLIIATQGMIPIYVYVRGKRVLSGKSENTLLHPKYRGKGLLQNLYEFAVSLCQIRGMEFIWGYSSSIAAIKALRKIRFLAYGSLMYISVSTIGPRLALSGVREENVGAVKRAVRSLVVLLLWVYSSIFRVMCWGSDTGLSVRDRLADQQDLADLYERLRNRYPDLIHIDLDERYLQWRIHDHPIFKYRTYFVYEGDLLRAYAFVNMHDKRRVYLTDFTFETHSAGKFLLQKVLGQLRTEGVGAVVFWGNKQNPAMNRVFGLLQSFGFLRRKDPTHVVLRNLSFEDGEALLDMANWYLNGLWTEGYRM